MPYELPWPVLVCGDCVLRWSRRCLVAAPQGCVSVAQELSQLPAPTADAHAAAELIVRGPTQSFEWHSTAAVRGRGGRRTRASGRPWEYHVSSKNAPSREPSPRQQDLIRMWRLDEPGDRVLLCNLHRAEAIVKRWLARNGRDVAVRDAQLSVEERDELKLVYRPGDVCHTLTSSASNLYYISSPDGRSGFVTSESHGLAPRIYYN